MENPTNGDWVSTCFKDLKELGIEDSLCDIKQMTKMKFNKILKVKSIENAMKYLNGKIGRKGKEIMYSSISMADYLPPYKKYPSVRNKEYLPL